MGWKEELRYAIQALSELLKEERTLSAYEVHNSSLVQVLLHCVAGQVKNLSFKLCIRIFSFQKNFYLLIRSLKDMKFLWKCFQIWTDNQSIEYSFWSISLQYFTVAMVKRPM